LAFFDNIVFAGSFVCLRSFYDSYLLFRQPVQLVDQRVDLSVRGLDLSLQGNFFVRRGSFGELFMQGEHLLHQGDKRIVVGDVCGSV
jgi:hypothetical protein